MRFVFNHTPIAKMRHRHLRNGRTYDPQEKEKNSVKKIMQTLVNQALNGSNDERLEAAEIGTADCLHANFVFELPIPKSDNASIRNLKMWNIIQPSIKPDLDNLEKFYLDCANEIIFKDDRSIITCVKKKKYSACDQPKVIMNIEKKKNSFSLISYNVFKIFSPNDLYELMAYCAKISDLPLKKLEDSDNEKDQKAYIEYISHLIYEFSQRWAKDMSKINSKCKEETRFSDGKIQC